MKRVIAILATLCMILCLGACGTKQEPKQPAQDVTVEEADLESQEQKSEQAQPAEKDNLPTATSDDAELYIMQEEDGHRYVVTRYGKRAEGYALDSEGNILDKNEEIQVVRDNAYLYEPVRALSFVKNDYLLTLSAREEPVDNDVNVTRVNQYPVNAVLTLNYTPKEPTCNIVLLRSTDPNVADISSNTNQSILVNGEFKLENGQIAVQPNNQSRSLDFTVTAKYPGQTKIIANTLSGDVFAECVVSVQYGYVPSTPVPTETPTEQVNASGDATQHVHNYTKTIIEPTIWDVGYTLYTCTDCGYSYQDNYTSKLPAPEPVEPPHVHQYVASVVAPTEKEEGYTLYVCEGCGDSYKDNFIKPSGG